MPRLIRHPSESWDLGLLPRRGPMDEMLFAPTAVMPAKAGISCGGRYTGRMRRGGWTYVMTNKPRGVLYVGVAADLARRIAQHRDGSGSAFCRRYHLTRLVLAERHDTILDAIAREKALKAWKRDWKIALIEAANPEWLDLSAHVVAAD